ncbi:MAG: molybdopterin cofactor-binding domain-containing protein, partial [Pseudomonadota bacterium]
RADFSDKVSRGNADVLENVMAGAKVLYDGHAVAAVAATSAHAAKKALKLIKVEYDVLPHVTDVDASMQDGAPIIRDDEIKVEGYSANVMSRSEFGHGDLDAGFAAADVVMEKSFKTAATHQGYIEPHACMGSLGADGRGELWCCTQGHFVARNICADLLGIDSTQLRVVASEIGGGFGGKTTVFIEPVALALSRKTNRPVKIVMPRDDVFRATGPTASSSIDVKIGMKNDGTITAGQAILRMQGGAFPGSPVDMAAMCAF